MRYKVELIKHYVQDTSGGYWVYDIGVRDTETGVFKIQFKTIDKRKADESLRRWKSFESVGQATLAHESGFESHPIKNTGGMFPILFFK